MPFYGHTKALWPGYLPLTFAAKRLPGGFCRGSEEIRRADFGPSWRRVDKKAFGVHLNEGLGTQLTRTGKDSVHDLERLAVSPGDKVLPEDPWQSAGRLLLETD